MNLQQRFSDASRSEEIIWSFRVSPSVPGKSSFYEKIFRNGSPHNYKIYNILENIGKTQRSNFFNNFQKEIIALKNLPIGWDSYNADPPNYKALTNALNILDYLSRMDFRPTRIMPSVEGGVSFLFIRNIKYADIECDNDGDIFAGMSDRTGEPILWEVREESEEKSLSTTILKISSFLET